MHNFIKMKKIFNLSIFLIIISELIFNFGGFFVDHNNNYKNTKSEDFFNFISSDLNFENSSVIVESGPSSSILYVWGGNTAGQVGDGTNKQAYLPQPIDVDGDGTIGNENLIDVDLSFYFSSTLLDNNDGTQTLYLWGGNSDGQLGNGSNQDKITPNPIDIDGDGTIGNEKIIDFSLGDYHSSALLDNNDGTTTLYMWGANEFGQVGDGTNDHKYRPTSIDVDGNGIKGDEKIISIEMGTASSVLLDNGDDTNTLYMWGANNYGQVGDGTKTNRNKPVKIDIDGNGIKGDEKIVGHEINMSNSLALLDNGNGTRSIYFWGLSYFGQIGIGDHNGNSEESPTLIDVDGDGIKGNEFIIDYNTGFASSATIINEEGKKEFYIWGDNSEGQLGDGTGENKPGHNKPNKLNLDPFFSFDIIQKNQYSARLKIYKNLILDRYQRENITLIDKSGIEYELEYDESKYNEYEINNLSPGTNYLIDYIDVDGVKYELFDQFTILTDYLLNGINSWSSTSRTAEIIFDIESTNFGAFSEQERTINIQYLYSSNSKNSSDNITREENAEVIIDKNGKVSFDGLIPLSTYEITKIDYIKNNNTFKYSIPLSDNNIITTPGLGIYFDNSTFKIDEDSITFNSFEFSIYAFDEERKFDENGFIYLFFENVKGGDSPILAYKVNPEQSGDGEYKFEVRNLSSDTEYKLVGISFDRVLSLDDNNQEESFNISYNIKTKINTNKSYTYLYVITILVIFLIILILFSAYSSLKAYEKIREELMDLPF